MSAYIVTEGTPTAYGGRTVKLTPIDPVTRAERKPWSVVEDGYLVRCRRAGLSYKTAARILERTPASVIARHVFLKREGAA